MGHLWYINTLCMLRVVLVCVCIHMAYICILCSCADSVNVMCTCLCQASLFAGCVHTVTLVALAPSGCPALRGGGSGIHDRRLANAQASTAHWRPKTVTRVLDKNGVQLHAVTPARAGDPRPSSSGEVEVIQTCLD